MNDETKTLMIHVERIVRPVHATANRKLRMRRELLAHLHSALEEERPKGGTGSEILTRAKSRLGDPTQLTQQLQLTVPKLERLFLKKLPLPESIDRWEQRSENNWKFLTVVQALAVSGFSMVFTFLLIGFVAIVPESRQNAFFLMQYDEPTHYLLICIAAGIILSALPLLVMSLAEKTIEGGWRSRAVRLRAFAIFFFELLWIHLINSQILGRIPDLSESLNKIIASILVCTFNIIIVLVIKRMGNHHIEWKQLNIAE